MIGLIDANNFYVSCERLFDPRLVGKPVAVLSNNDGCCVSMSAEFKALGIARGTPYFQLKNRESKRDGDGGLVFRSSNYELYGDLSRRIVSILRKEAVDVLPYSIDESFVTPPTTVANDLAGYGLALRRKILRWVGIPCGVGFAKTKTLAKLANRLAKKRADGVYILPEDSTDLLATLPAEDVWGVGRRLTERLRRARVFTALDLRDAHDDTLRAVGGVTLLRTATELRGIPCIEERDMGEDPDSISCSRSYGTPVTTAEALFESIACFASLAAEKLRRHGLLASGCNVYAQFGSALEGRYTERTVVFPDPTDATDAILGAIEPAMPALFLAGERYRKAGLVFFGLEKPGVLRQADLFEQARPLVSSRLFAIVDRVNARFGKRSVGLASEGLRDEAPAWTMRRDKLSNVSTTDWRRLPRVR